MSSYLKIEWSPLTYPLEVKSGKMSSVISSLVAPLTKEKPILLFFGTQKYKTPKKISKKQKDAKEREFTKEAIRSAEFAAEFFDENYQMQLALKFFNCYDIDLKDIPKSKSKVLCHENAPLLVIYDKKKIVKVLTYKDKARIYNQLISTLKDRDVDIRQLNRKAVKPIQDLLLLNQKLFLVENGFEELKDKYKKSPSAALKKKLIKYNSKYKTMDIEKGKVQSQLSAIIKQYDKKSPPSISY